MNGDQPLTENGEAQAECFGEYWAPILEGPARAGKLHVFCSPMVRNMQTVAPLMRKLGEKGIELTAEVRPDNCEVPGTAMSQPQMIGRLGRFFHQQNSPNFPRLLGEK